MEMNKGKQLSVPMTLVPDCFLYPFRILTVRFANVHKDIRSYLFLVLQSLSM